MLLLFGLIVSFLETYKVFKEKDVKNIIYILIVCFLICIFYLFKDNIKSIMMIIERVKNGNN